MNIDHLSLKITVSHISIRVIDPSDEAMLVRAIRPITGQAIAEIQSCLREGRPIYERELFLNDFAEVADKIRELVVAIKEAGAEPRISESGEQIDEEGLANLLEGSEDYEL